MPLRASASSHSVPCLRLPHALLLQPRAGIQVCPWAMSPNHLHGIFF